MLRRSRPSQNRGGSVVVVVVEVVVGGVVVVVGRTVVGGVVAVGVVDEVVAADSADGVVVGTAAAVHAEASNISPTRAGPVADMRDMSPLLAVPVHRDPPPQSRRARPTGPLQTGKAGRSLGS